MATTLDLVDNVADAITRLRYLEKKSKDDDEMLKLLKKQKDDMATELANAKHDFGVELYQAQQERDAAVKMANEVKMVIEAVGNMALSGIRKLKGDEVQPPGMQPPLIVKHLQATDKRLPPITPEMDKALPDKPLFLRENNSR